MSKKLCGSPLAQANSFFCSRRGFGGTSKDDTSSKVTEYFSFQHTEYSSSRWRETPCLTLNVLTKTHGCKKTAQILRHEKDCHEEDGVFLGKIQGLHQRRSAKHERRLSTRFVGEIDETDGQRKVRDVLGNHTTGGNPSENTFENNTWTHCTSGQSRGV